MPHSILELLAGGDLRSIGATPLVVRRVLRAPALLPTLVRGLAVPDPVVRMRAADALEKLARHGTMHLARYRGRLLRVAQMSRQPEVQWHMAQLLPRLALTPDQRARARRTMRRYLGSPSSIVRTMALAALTRLAPDTPAGERGVLRLLRSAAKSGTPAMRARARRLLKGVGSRPRGQRPQL